MRKQMPAFVLMFYSATSIAQFIFVWGGGQTCGEAMQNIERRGQSAETHYVQFVLGYLSGYNSAALEFTKKDALTGEGVSSETIAAMFKNKCRQDALKTLFQAATEIRIDLEKQTP